MNPSRFPILVFTLVGLLLFLAGNGLIWGVNVLARGPHRDVAGVVAEVWNWIGPPSWLLAIALCLLLTTESTTPTWTRGKWPLAAVVFYLFHLPLMLPFAPTAIFGRWGFTVYLFLGSMGAVCAMRLLLGSFHLAALFLLAEPILRGVLWGNLHHATRSAMLAVFSVIGFSLIGWWFRDVMSNHKPQPTLGTGA